MNGLEFLALVIGFFVVGMGSFFVKEWFTVLRIDKSIALHKGEVLTDIKYQDSTSFKWRWTVYEWKENRNDPFYSWASSGSGGERTREDAVEAARMFVDSLRQKMEMDMEAVSYVEQL